MIEFILILTLGLALAVAGILRVHCDADRVSISLETRLVRNWFSTIREACGEFLSSRSHLRSNSKSKHY
jgi:hypothetical protein